MTKTESAHLTAQTVLIESAEEALQISGAAGVRLAIPDTDALIMVGPADWIAKNVPGVEAMVAQMEAIAALEKIARWHGEFPATGKTWPDGSPTSYAAEYGSNGERDYMRQVALDALARLAATTQASTAQAERDSALEEAASLVENCDKRASLRGIACAIRTLRAVDTGELA